MDRSYFDADCFGGVEEPMKTLSRLLMLAALATAFALPAFAQDPAASPAGLCDEAAKNDLYTQYYNLKKTNQANDQAKAYDIAKQYIAKYGSCTDQYTTALKTWVGKYEAALGSVNRRSDFFNAYNAKDAAKLTSLGNQLLSSDPNDVAVALLAAAGTYDSVRAGNTAAAADATRFANIAVQLLEAGKEPTNLEGKINWLSFSNKDEAIAYLNYALGAVQGMPNLPTTNHDEAVKQLVKVAQSSSKYKEQPGLYILLANLYRDEVAPMYQKYQTYKEVTPESQLLLANINQVVDRLIDVYARAVAYETDATKKASYMKDLTELYKSRHDNSETGLTEYIAGIKSQPLLVTQPLTALPAPTPATGTGDGAAATTTTPTTTPAATNVAAPASSTAKPATNTTATQPKPPANTSSTTTNPPAKKKP
jgi:hypothetical protein